MLGRRACRWGAVAVSVGALAGTAACGAGTGTAGTAASSAPPASAAPAPTNSVGTSTAPMTTPAGAGMSAAPVPVQTEFNPPGDIPDNQTYVPHTVPGSRVTVSAPEGWSQSTIPGGLRFQDKLNSIEIALSRSGGVPTTAGALAAALPTLRATVAKFSAGSASTVQRAAGTAVLLTYQGDSPRDAVTNKVVRDVFQRYVFWRHGMTVVLTLGCPTNADNVDPWRTVSNSVRLP